MASKNPPDSKSATRTLQPSRDDARRKDAPPGANEGEGNKSADRHYREATREFVNSPRGQKEVERAGDVSAGEERDIEEAEDAAKRRAREHDPQEVRERR